MNDRLESFLTRRLLLVTGKGGTGKTVISAALAVIAARRGLETLVVETADEPALPRLLASEPRGVAEEPASDRGSEEALRTPLRVGSRLQTLRIDPSDALTEYLEIQLGMRAPVQLVVRNQGFRRLMDAAPGWRELITLGKLWHLESRMDAAEPRYDLIVVDAPSTGHGLSFLSVPGVVLSTVRLGPLRRHTDLVQSLLTNPARTWVVPVTLLEELPVREVLELIEGVRDLGLAVGPVVVNGVEAGPAIGEPELDAALAALASLGPEARALQGGLDVASVRRCVESARRRAALQSVFRARLGQALPAPPLEVPYLTEGVTDRGGVERLADALEAAARAETAA